MGLKSEQITEHCKIIIKSPRINNKIVVLCEGEISKIDGRPSPQSYRRMEQMPDANFYKACVPNWWSQYKPQFFNCGDRQDVIETYFNLLELHKQDINNSYLSSERLFAIVDLDLQIHNISINFNYKFSDTEEIFYNLYHQAKVQEVNAIDHRIWVTGLIHKEAYFIIPELQQIFNNFSTVYNGNSLKLQDIYISMADAIDQDEDLKINLPKVYNRISHCSGLDCNEVDKLKDSWKQEFQNAKDDIRKDELVLALLTLRKAKSYWNQIQPPSDWTASAEAFKDQLLLEIGRFYSEQSNNKYHISCFFRTLRQFI